MHEFRDHCSVSKSVELRDLSIFLCLSIYISHDNANISDRDEGCVVLECRDDGSFFPMYCKGETCWCTDVTKGNEIENTRGPKGSFHCTEQGVKVKDMTYSTFADELTKLFLNFKRTFYS